MAWGIDKNKKGIKAEISITGAANFISWEIAEKITKNKAVAKIASTKKISLYKIFRSKEKIKFADFIKGKKR